ncbi:MAG: sugar phosphate isomerase/epimerase [Candidatus Latescibacteria bacterium]|nr:sugar phosphate isomerase/epimerase [Candidatus Latescibacterota bacterium]
MATITAASTLAFSLSPLEVALEHIAAYGFSKVELSDQVTHSQHYGVDSVDPLEVKGLLSRYALEPVAVNACLSAVSDPGRWSNARLPVERQSAAETEEIREAKKHLVFLKLHDKQQSAVYIERAQRLIQCAKTTGIPRVCLQGGRRKQIQNLADELRTAAGVIDGLAAYARDRGVKILLEMPHVWDLYYDVDRSKEMLSHLRSDNIGVLIDATHWHTSGYDIDDYVRFLGDRLWHIHLRDAAGHDTPVGDYQLEKTPGKGEVDFGHLGETLDKYGYRGEVTLETEYKNYGCPEEVDEENHYALAYLKSVGWSTSASAET